MIVISTTQNYGLPIVTDAEAPTTNFIDWRNALTGETATSAMKIIDAKLKELSDGKADLVGGKVPVAQLPEMNYDPNGTATTVVAAHNAASDAHATEFASKADLIDGVIPASQLPSYVDDVLEYSSLAAFPITGESGKIYVAQDTNMPYRWSGSGYVAISSSIALGETSSTAYRGDRGKIAYDHSQSTQNPHAVTKAQVGLGSVDNTADADKPISTAQAAVNTQKADKAVPAAANNLAGLDANGNLVDSGKKAGDFENSGAVSAHNVAADAHSAKFAAKQDKHLTCTVSLTVAGWSSLSQTVTVSGVTTANTVFVAPASASQGAYTDGGVKCTAQATNSLTFTCESVPTAALSINVVILGV